MAKFRKKKNKEIPEISTSSLPDLIFILLFFFMITTTMREVSMRVRVKLPNATEVQKLEKKSLVSFIYIGPPLDTKLGTESRVQLNDQLARIEDVTDFIAHEREARSEADRGLLTTSLKCHNETKMGVITDVKQELRKAGSFRLHYATLKGEK